MRQKIVGFLMMVLLLIPLGVGAQGNVGVEVFPTSYSEPYVYSRTYDNLAIDFVLWSDDYDVLNTLVVRNEGSARHGDEISRMVLWVDDGNGEFDGWGIDTEIATTTTTSTSPLWVFDGLAEPIDYNGTNFYVSFDTKYSGDNGDTFNFSIPKYFDNGNGVYDPGVGDQGIFLESQTPLPEESLQNSTIGIYRKLTVDPSEPQIVITAPVDDVELYDSLVVVDGIARDQGGGYVDYVELCVIDPNLAEPTTDCYPVEATGMAYDSWEFIWEDMVNGYYGLYAQAIDDTGNVGISNLVFVSVDVPVLPPEELDNPYIDGRFIKTADRSAVYFLDQDNVRHAYPTQDVWESYFGKDFSFVETITTSEMANYSLGHNVPFNIGVLMKIPSVPKVYLVGYDREINWLTSEDVARNFYGPAWPLMVVDLPESFFHDYFEGQPIY